ncbi:MFS transporter [Pseudolysinimonas sp.]
MIAVLRNPAYAKLFAAQVVALLGTGLLTVALGLLAFDLAGEDAGVVLGTALAIKMVAYVGVAPLVAALVHRVPRKAVLVGADVVRGLVALSLPFVTEAWQIYPLIFVLQAASATFTPTFQSVIPDVLPDERQYTRALSLSRLAYDLESLGSPAIAAALLVVVSYHDLFVGTVVGFAGSALLVLFTRVPGRADDEPSPFLERLTRGARVFGRVPELRALLALNLAVAAPTAMVVVNTVVVVQGDLRLGQPEVALLLAASGGGSMLVALVLPRVLDRLPDRRVMLAGASGIPLALAGAALVLAVPGILTWPSLVALWVLLGVANSLVLTPSARLVRRATDERTRPAVFAAQFSLSHACYLLTYPLAGFVGAAAGTWVAAAALAAVAVVGAALARVFWRSAAAVGGDPRASRVTALRDR